MGVNSKYLDNKATFIVKNAKDLSYLYFPLVNEYGLKSAITPSLSGDCKIDQNHFALLPMSVEDLHASKAKRNVFFLINNQDVFATSGETPLQLLNNDEEVTVEGGFLYHKVTRTTKNYQISTTSFIPSIPANIEISQVTYKNVTDKEITIKPIVSVPLYSRSADNIRDHRHVTALLNKATIVENGIINRPTLSFDERGHLKNDASYGIFVDSHQTEVYNYWPILEEFIGEGKDLLTPNAIKNEIKNNYHINSEVEGYEMIGGFEFKPLKLNPNESLTLNFAIVIGQSNEETVKVYNQYGKIEQFDQLFNDNQAYWEGKLASLKFDLSDDNFNKWLKWVTLQPILRRLYGNSFLPFHDYGKGGRGWRDLWQDCLALLLMNPKEVRPLLYSSFAGVRIDGSNATIIGCKEGEFLADRNNIVRVWMEHGAWPLLTTKLYLDRSGDLDFLFNLQTYFKDQFSHYTKSIDSSYVKGNSNYLLDKENKIYQGTIFEHLLLENLTPFFNVGKHNIIRLEDADWNDGMDMAKEQGESVAFTALYAYNLETLSDILRHLVSQGVNKVEILEEITTLFKDIELTSIDAKHQLLNSYFDIVTSKVSGKKVNIDCLELANRLTTYSNVLKNQIQKSEWMENDDDGWFNGYYDNDGERVESIYDKIKMTLTGQVFNIMGNVATPSQVKKIINSANKYLFDEKIKAYRLNTNFGENKMNMGRFMGFAYGHKENGSIFSHMNIMYAASLLKRGFVREGRAIIDNIYNYATNINQAKCYPNIPEYFDIKGRGVYPYLTGSASWVILTMVDDVFGIKGRYGDLYLAPKLLKNDFKDGKCEITTYINGYPCKVIYHNKKSYDYDQYHISNIKINDCEVNFSKYEQGVIVSKSMLKDLRQIDIYLD
jgi:cellobiose phosphorylase